MGNKIPVVAKFEFYMGKNMQPDLHLLDAKQMEDFQSFLKLLLATAASGGMLNHKEIF